MLSKKVYALILAGGEGKRFGNSLPKQFLKLGDKSLLEWAIEPFELTAYVDEIVLVVNERYLSFAENLLRIRKYSKLQKVIVGGKTRQESSRFGIKSVDDKDGLVLIHDAARPFVFVEDIERLVSELESFRAVTLAIPVKETVAFAEDFIVEDIPSREKLFVVQTPQGFHLPLIREAHNRALKEGFSDAPDDCSLILRYFKWEKIKLLLGRPWNIKITYPHDLKLAEILLSEKINKGGNL